MCSLVTEQDRDQRDTANNTTVQLSILRVLRDVLVLLMKSPVLKVTKL